MAKILILALALAALVGFAEVLARRTMVTTAVDEVKNPWGRGSQEECREQIQRQQMGHCRMYLSRQGSRYDDVLEMAIENPQEEHLQQCCQQLRNIDEQCQCEAIQEAFRQAQQQSRCPGSQQARGEQQMRQMAQNLPRECNLETQQCQI